MPPATRAESPVSRNLRGLPQEESDPCPTFAGVSDRQKRAGRPRPVFHAPAGTRASRSAAAPDARAAPPARLWRSVAAIAVASAIAVALAGGGDAFWLCLPAVLLACALTRTRTEAFIAAAIVVGAAAAPLSGWLDAAAVPSPLLTCLVIAASACVLVALRERLENERDALRSAATSDPLTGVANRRLLLSRAEYEIARHSRARHSFAVVMLDLDGFKLLNDRFGHPAGDEVLCDVAAALARTMRGQDTVARLGGDEFCVLAPETDGPHTVPLARRIAATVRDATSGIETLSASVGVAIFPDDGDSAAALLQAADERLLAAKRERPSDRTRRRAA
jgi:diguanylate cyclase (GGDEF)-like protein